MRKIFTLAISFFIIISINAQIKKESLFLGGDVGATTLKTKSADTLYSNQNGIFISPVLGKAIKDNLVFGGHIDFRLADYDNPGNYPHQKENSYGAGVFLRKYTFIGNSGFSIFVEGDFGYSYYHNEIGNPPNWPPSSDTKRHMVYVSAYPGLSFSLSKKLQLETGFNNFLYANYSHEVRVDQTSPVSTFKSNGFSVGSSLNNLSNLYVGFRLLIGK